MDLNPVNLVDIDEGKLRKSIDDHLSMIAKDVIRRSGKTAARKVKIEISLTPSENDEHDVREVEINWKVDFRMPGKKGSASKAAIIDGLVLVNPWDGLDPRQTIIPEVKDAPLENLNEALEHVTQAAKKTEEAGSNVFHSEFPASKS